MALQLFFIYIVRDNKITQVMQFAERSFWHFCINRNLNSDPWLFFTKIYQTFNCNFWSVKYAWILEQKKKIAE